jgi:hypothetical protein
VNKLNKGSLLILFEAMKVALLCLQSQDLILKFFRCVQETKGCLVSNQNLDRIGRTLHFQKIIRVKQDSRVRQFQKLVANSVEGSQFFVCTCMSVWLYGCGMKGICSRILILSNDIPHVNRTAGFLHF